MTVWDTGEMGFDVTAVFNGIVHFIALSVMSVSLIFSF